ncbi:MAG: hypothetical protein ACREQ9_10535, partial [Candidatus Binatia bacterium]
MAHRQAPLPPLRPLARSRARLRTVRRRRPGAGRHVARRARSLLAIERQAEHSPAIARAYREGSLSWLRTLALLPVGADDQAIQDEWIERARQVTIRRLIDEVGWALEWRVAGGADAVLRPPALGDRLEPAWAGPPSGNGEVQMRAEEDRFRQVEFAGPASVIAFFRAAVAAW